MRGVQLGLIDAGSSTHSLSVTVEMSLEHEEIRSSGSIGGNYYSRMVFISLGGPDCADTIRGRHPIEEL